MAGSARELVYRCLDRDRPWRAARQLWTLPWAEQHHPAELAAIRREFPDDMVHLAPVLRTPGIGRGDPWAPGESTDDWGCRFTNLQAGIIGEVKQPLVHDWDRDGPAIRLPVEWLTLDTDAINARCAAEERFTIAGMCPRPFERLQFLRGTEALYLDLAEPPDGLLAFLPRLRAFYNDVMEQWAARTRIDALFFIDDWGSQHAPLISPTLWRQLFRPFYADFAAIARAYGKRLFMHSDGFILPMLGDLADLGVDAINAQIACMGPARLAPLAGRITFWGEVDRQNILPRGTPADVRAAVAETHAALWRDGGCMAQCEFGPGARPENVREVFAAWDALTSKQEVVDWKCIDRL
jgi:hypothetical protein